MGKMGLLKKSLTDLCLFDQMGLGVEIMQTRKDRHQEELFVATPLRSLIPEDHILRRVDAVLDLSWLHDAVRACYSQDTGRASIDPESALRLMLAGFFEGIVEDRRLMRRAQTDLAFRWFAGYRLDEKLPDHSSLTRIRQRWGSERFEMIFQRTVEACQKAGLVDGTTVHVDATLIRANASMGSVTKRHVEQVQTQNPMTEERSDEEEKPPTSSKSGRRAGRFVSRSSTDPDSRMARSRKGQTFAPRFKQHAVCDDKAGIILDVQVTRANINEGRVLLEQVRRTQARTGISITTLTADASYSHGQNYAELEALSITPVIPPQPQRRYPGHVPTSRFRYDPRHRVVRCPGGKTLQRKSRCAENSGWSFSARTSDCAGCALRTSCFSPKASRKIIRIMDGHEALLRARRHHTRGWDTETRAHYSRHRWRAEGIHGEAKTQHGLARAARRGLTNIAIQSYLTAAVMNLKRLAKTTHKRTTQSHTEQPRTAQHPDIRQRTAQHPLTRLLAKITRIHLNTRPGIPCTA